MICVGACVRERFACVCVCVLCDVAPCSLRAIGSVTPSPRSATHPGLFVAVFRIPKVLVRSGHFIYRTHSHAHTHVSHRIRSG